MKKIVCIVLIHALYNQSLHAMDAAKDHRAKSGSHIERECPDCIKVGPVNMGALVAGLALIHKDHEAPEQPATPACAALVPKMHQPPSLHRVKSRALALPAPAQPALPAGQKLLTAISDATIDQDLEDWVDSTFVDSEEEFVEVGIDD